MAMAAAVGCQQYAGPKTACTGFLTQHCVSWYEPTKEENDLERDASHAAMISASCGRKEIMNEKNPACLIAELVRLKWELGYLKHGNYDKDLWQFREMIASGVEP